MTTPSASIALKTQAATLGYQGVPVVHDANLEVHAGELVAILGGNGSGKSTFVRGILGLTQLISGSISLFGAPHADASARRTVGYVPQHQSVRTGVPVTVGEVVASGANALVPPWRRLPVDQGKRIAHALERVGLADKAKTPMQNLSGGQRRRALLARALAPQPRMLILDEPTAGVDAANQQALADTFAALLADGLPIVLVTHELGPVRALTSRAVVFDNGAITFDGPPEDLEHHHHSHGGDHHVHAHEPPSQSGMGLL